MNAYCKKHGFQLQIKLLALFKPTLLFDKINQLDWYKNTLQQWIKDQGFNSEGKILEVGCASGSLTHFIAQSGGTATGVDRSKKMIELAKKNHKDIEFLVADATDLPLKSERFDGVIAASLLNIVSDKTKLLHELSRTCKKGGVITVLVPAENFSENDFISLQTSLGIKGFSAAAIEAWHKNPPKMNTTDISNLFKQAGLTEISTKYYLQGMVVSVSAVKPAFCHEQPTTSKPSSTNSKHHRT